jgi:sarcosine oxidase subunit alpha
MCVSGRCPNCLVNVDGVPNVRACTEPVRPGAQVTHQNAWPSLDRDILSLLDRLDRLMPVGFYYKTLHRPKVLWKLAQPVIRKVAGLGRIDVDAPVEPGFLHQSLHTDVAVVGGGAAGMSAALAAAKDGARVTLIDDAPALGGHLRTDSTIHGPDSVPAYEAAADLARQVSSLDGVTVLSGSTAFGLYEDNLLGILAPDRLVKLRARSVVVAAGVIEQPLVFDANDRPGVMLADGARRLARFYGVKPGERAVVATVNNEGYAAALELHDAGVSIAALVDSRPEPARDAAVDAVRAAGIPILMGHAVTRAVGRHYVRAAVVERLEKGVPTGEERRIGCDLICMSGTLEPADALIRQSGSGGTPGRVYRAGGVAGARSLAQAVQQGHEAGALAAGSDGPSQSYVSTSVERAPLLPGGGKKRFVCFCEDITAKDIEQAVHEGFDDIQTLKRYSTVTMGPCQGKMCHSAAADICARATGRPLDEVGSTTSRPPLQPVPMSALAGRAHLPVKRTPMHRKHVELGARVVDLGPWKRPYSYGSPQEECLAVRQRVGIIDVSTLGKLDVRGPDAPALLDKVYTHNFSGLRPGRVRYGVLCGDNGTIMDDGTVARLSGDRYFVTTTTGNVESIEEWLKWWMAGTDMEAYVSNVTSGYAAINVAGPRARETLSRITDVDLAADRFRYMRCREGVVAGVPSMLLRIGFVGETGWEVHFPAEFGEHMWDALMDAGREFGIAPFGLEAQRILRLEKGHVIVGQDTDLVSTPFDSGMEWVVRFEKKDFIGRGGLSVARDRGLDERLVGFTMSDGLVPDDGSQIVDAGRPIGRVTSARLSPTIGKGFGLARVPAELAEEGREVHVRMAGSDVPASVTLKPIYDPEGKRPRE